MDINEFWKITGMLDWNYENGDNDLIIKPALEYLASKSNEEIFEFEEIMSKLLYDIDGEQWYTDDSGDCFLYERCVAIVNGKEYYDDVKSGKIKLDEDMEFESILYLPIDSWALKNNTDAEKYSHICQYNYESFSNVENWSHLDELE